MGTNSHRDRVDTLLIALDRVLHQHR
jgi:hypothetical protein